MKIFLISAMGVKCLLVGCNGGFRMITDNDPITAINKRHAGDAESQVKETIKYLEESGEPYTLTEIKGVEQLREILSTWYVLLSPGRLDEYLNKLTA